MTGYGTWMSVRLGLPVITPMSTIPLVSRYSNTTSASWSPFMSITWGEPTSGAGAKVVDGASDLSKYWMRACEKPAPSILPQVNASRSPSPSKSARLARHAPAATEPPMAVKLPLGRRQMPSEPQP